MRVLILGATGQLGRALCAVAPEHCQIAAPSKVECDISNCGQLSQWFENFRPDLAFNTAAYTAVDLAESYPQAAERTNASGAGQLAQMAQRYGTQLVHISTDFIFDGRSGTPYAPDDAANPLNVYGRTKLAGEVAIRKAHSSVLIVRTAWLYAEHGTNFLHTMLRLMRERNEVRVVTDQVGTPTSAINLARVLWELVAAKAMGTYHFTDSGVASWYDFAQAIQEYARAFGLLDRVVPIVPIRTCEYPTAAVRPQFSVLDKSKTWDLLGRTGQHWREALRGTLKNVRDHG